LSDSSPDIRRLIEEASEVVSPLGNTDGIVSSGNIWDKQIQPSVAEPANSSRIGFFTVGSSLGKPPKTSDVGAVLVRLISDVYNGFDRDRILNLYTNLVAAGEIPALKPYDQDAVLEVVKSFGPLTYRQTKNGFVRLFVDLHGHRIRYCGKLGNLFAYDDSSGTWVENRGDCIESLVSDTVESLGVLVGLIQLPDVQKSYRRFLAKLDDIGLPTSVARAIKGKLSIGIKPDEFDSDPFEINLQNIVYDLRSGATLDHHPQHYSTKVCGTAFDANADCPFFKKTIHNSFDGDADTISYVQRLLGYCLSGDTSAKRFWIFYGGNDCGKSMLLRVMHAILGGDDGYYGTIPTDTLEAGGHDNKNLGLMSMHGQERLAVIDELTPGYKFDTGKLKCITGDTTGVTMRLNFKSYSSRKIKFKVIIATNHLPVYDQVDSAIRSRAVVVRFPKKFKRVRDFDSNWQKELPGILNWLIQGYTMYESLGLDVLPPKIAAATKEHLDGVDTFALWLDSEVRRDSGAAAIYSVMDVLGRYQKWLSDQGLPKSRINHLSIGHALREHGWVVCQVRNSALNNEVGVEELRFKGDT